MAGYESVLLSALSNKRPDSFNAVMVPDTGYFSRRKRETSLVSYICNLETGALIVIANLRKRKISAVCRSS